MITLKKGDIIKFKKYDKDTFTWEFGVIGKVIKTKDKSKEKSYSYKVVYLVPTEKKTWFISKIQDLNAEDIAEVLNDNNVVGREHAILSKRILEGLDIEVCDDWLFDVEYESKTVWEKYTEYKRMTEGDHWQIKHIIRSLFMATIFTIILAIFLFLFAK